MRHGATAMIEAKAGGKIITVSSVHGLGASHRNGIYSATKAGIIALTKSAAYDLAKFDIQVNCIAPGAVPVPKDPPPPADSNASSQHTPGRLVPASPLSFAASWGASMGRLGGNACRTSGPMAA